MKRIILLLLICLPILGYGQSLSTQINNTIRGKNYDPTKSGDMYQAIADRVEAAPVSGTNTYTATISSLTSYNSVQTLQLNFANANTGASTLQILPNLTVKPLKKISSGVAVDVSSGDITIGVHTVWYDGTNLIISLGGTGGGSTSLTSGHLLVGNVSNIATDVPLSGDASLSNAGAITVTKINGVTVPAGLYGSQSANQVWASPSGSSGAAIFRGLTNADLSGTNAALYDANSNLTIHNSLEGYTSIATNGGSSALFVSSPRQVYFTGSTTQTCLLPVASTLVPGFELEITNLSTGVVTVQSSGGNTIQAMASRSSLIVTCILTSGTGTASWSAVYNPSIDGSFGGSGTVTSVSSANGNLTITNPTTTPTLTVVSAPKLTTGHTLSATGDITWTSPPFDGSADVTSSSTVTKINGTSLAGLGTGILKNTTGTGIPSIAIAADFPTLNQNTTGTAAGLTTGRTISITGDMSYTSSLFDGTGNATAAGTLATVNSTTGSFGSSTAIPSFTVNGKGLITLASTNAVIAPASTLSGTTLNSSIVNSSLTSVGTITSGTWNGTPITNSYLATSYNQTANNGSDFADAGSTSLNLKTPVVFPAKVVSVSNIASLSGTTTVDGVALVANDRILLTGQSTASQNGPWLIQAGAWIRPTDFATGTSIKGKMSLVSGGTTYSTTIWVMSNTNNPVIDTDAITWTCSNPPIIRGTITTTTSLTSADLGKIFVVSGTTSNYTITLPTATGNGGKSITFEFDITTSLSKLITISGFGGTETLDNRTTRQFWAGESITLESDNATNWRVLTSRSKGMGCIMSKSTQSFGNTGTLAKFLLDTNTSDNTAMMGNTGSNRIDILRTNYYMVSATIQTSSSITANQLHSQIYVNGSATNPAGFYYSNVASFANATISVVLRLNAGDYVEVYGSQQSSGTNNLNGYLQVAELGSGN